MYYVSDTPYYPTTLDLLGAVRVPPLERSGSQNRIIHCFFTYVEPIPQLRNPNLLARTQFIQSLRLVTKKSAQFDTKVYSCEEESIVISSSVVPYGSDQQFLPLVTQIREYSIFRGFSFHEELYLAYHARRVFVPHNECLYRAGDPTDALYLLESGTILYLVGEDNVSEIKLSQVEGGTGQCIGDEALLNQPKRRFTARCISSEAVLLSLPAHAFKNIAHVNPKVLENMKSFLELKQGVRSTQLTRIERLQSTIRQNIVRPALNKKTILPVLKKIGSMHESVLSQHTYSLSPKSLSIYTQENIEAKSPVLPKSMNNETKTIQQNQGFYLTQCDDPINQADEPTLDETALSPDALNKSTIKSSVSVVRSRSLSPKIYQALQQKGSPSKLVPLIPRSGHPLLMNPSTQSFVHSLDSEIKTKEKQSIFARKYAQIDTKQILFPSSESQMRRIEVLKQLMNRKELEKSSPVHKPSTLNRIAESVIRMRPQPINERPTIKQKSIAAVRSPITLEDNPLDKFYMRTPL